MIQTPTLQLEKYELDDAANLADGYNNSMDKIDAYAGTINAKFPITGANIEDGSINTVDIANGAITEVKLAADAVTNDKIAPGAVTESELSDNVNNTLAKVGANEALIEEHVNYFAALGVTNEQSADDLHTQIDNTYQAAMSNTQSIAEINAPNHTIIFGDSWSDPNFTYAWPKYFRTKNTVHNYAKGGAGYVHSTGTPFLQQITQAKDDSSFENTKVDEIIIIFGANDYAENSTQVIANATNGFAEVKTNWPTANVRVGWNFCFSQTATDTIYSTIRQVATAALQAGLLFDWRIMELMMNGTNTQFYQTDNIHPNETGAKVIAAYLSNESRGSANCYSNITSFLTPGNNPTGVSAHNVNKSIAYISDGKISIHYTASFTTTSEQKNAIVLSMNITSNVNLYMTAANPEQAVHVGSNSVVGTLTKIGNTLYTVIKPITSLPAGSYQIEGNAVWSLC